jgi:hypothetical protein
LQGQKEGPQEMTWTKRQIIEQAFSSVGLASYVFDLTAEELQAATRSLDAMMAVWGARGARIGYNPGADLDEASGLPDWANEAAYLNLGCRLAAGLGKAVMPEIKQEAARSYRSVLSVTSQPIPMKLDIMPAGAGNKTFNTPYTRFIINDEQPIAAGLDGDLEFDG